MDEAKALLTQGASSAMELAAPLRSKLDDLLSERLAPVLAPMMKWCTPLQAALQSEPLFYCNALGAEDAAVAGGDQAAEVIFTPSLLSPASLELDTMCLGLMLLTICHATLHHRMLWVLAYTTTAIGAEQAFIRVGGTHCHEEALLMVSQCSSANSIAVYVPGLYVCLLAAERLHLHPIARPFAAGALLNLYALPYLAQGATQQWWTYTSTNASGGEALPLKGRDPMWTLAGGWNSTTLVPSAATAALLESR